MEMITTTQALHFECEMLLHVLRARSTRHLFVLPAFRKRTWSVSAYFCAAGRALGGESYAAVRGKSLSAQHFRRRK